MAAMVDGSCAVVLPDGVLTCSVPTEEKRSVEGPENETEAKGARDSFVESVRTSTSLVRRRLKSAKVKMDICLLKNALGRLRRRWMCCGWRTSPTRP